MTISLRSIPLILALATLLSTAALADDVPTAAPPVTSPAQGGTTAIPNGAAVPLSAYVPSSAAMLVGVDSKWLWDSTADVREIKAVKAQISEAQALLNVTPESDIMPWLGRTYIALLPGASTTSPPRVVVYAQIRDAAAYAADSARITTNVADRPHITMTTVSIDGRTVVKVNGPDKSMPQLIFVADGGWVILTVDGAAMHRVLDTLTGSYSNITTKATFMKAFVKAESSADASIWGAMSNSIGDIMAADMAHGKPTPTPKPGSLQAALVNGASEFTMVDKGTTLRCDSIGYVDDAAGQAAMVKMFSGFKPITGDSFNHIPNDTFICVLGENPMSWVRFVQQMLQDSPQKDNPLGSMDFVAMLKPYAGILDPLTGEFNFSGLVHDGNFGMTLLCQADDQSSAQKSLNAAVATLKQYHVPLTSAAGVYTMTGGPEEAPFPVSPSLRASNGYVEFTTSKKWLDLPTGTPELQMPAEAAGSFALELGNFKFVDPLVAMAGKVKSNDAAMTKFLSDMTSLHVSDGSWALWGKFDPTGSSSSSVFTIDNLDWKATINSVAEYIADEVGKPPVAAVNSPAAPEAAEKALLAKGATAPDFTVTSVAGTPVKLSDYRGKVVVIDFWSTWCGPCQSSLPHTEAVAAKYANKGVVFLGVNVWDNQKAFDDWIPQHKQYSHIHFAIDPSAQESDVASTKYNVDGIPTQYIIDRNGKVVDSIVGFDGPSMDLSNAINTALAKH